MQYSNLKIEHRAASKHQGARAASSAPAAICRQHDHCCQCADACRSNCNGPSSWLRSPRRSVSYVIAKFKCFRLFLSTLIYTRCRRVQPGKRANVLLTVAFHAACNCWVAVLAVTWQLDSPPTIGSMPPPQRSCSCSNPRLARSRHHVGQPPSVHPCSPPFQLLFADFTAAQTRILAAAFTQLRMHCLAYPCLPSRSSFEFFCTGTGCTMLSAPVTQWSRTCLLVCSGCAFSVQMRRFSCGCNGPPGVLAPRPTSAGAALTASSAPLLRYISVCRRRTCESLSRVTRYADRGR